MKPSMMKQNHSLEENSMNKLIGLRAFAGILSLGMAPYLLGR